MHTVAVLLAGGTGQRVDLGIPKQFLKVAGKTILEHTILTFLEHDRVDEVLVTIAPDYHDEARAIVDRLDPQKPVRVLDGGVTRSESTRAAIAALADRGDCYVLVHDAVRPLVPPSVISRNIEALATHEAVDTVMPTADTIVRVTSEGDRVEGIPSRDVLRRGQTPQSFRLETLRRAYALAAEDGSFVATDDCGVVLHYLPDVEMAAVEGSEENMKVTRKVDLHLLDKLFQLSESMPPEVTEHRLHRELAGRTVVVLGGSSGIGASVVASASSYGANALAFSRSTTDLHVQDRQRLRQVATEVEQQYGSVDHVINCAGILPQGDLCDASDEDIWGSTEVNYVAPVLIAQTFHEALVRSGGSLTFFTSSAYTRGRAGYALYSSAKAAVVNLTQALADEWSDSGVRVNCISPERTSTPMRSNAFGHEPAGSLLSADDVGVLTLAVLTSGETGHVYDVRRAAHEQPGGAGHAESLVTSPEPSRGRVDT